MGCMGGMGTSMPHQAWVGRLQASIRKGREEEGDKIKVSWYKNKWGVTPPAFHRRVELSGLGPHCPPSRRCCCILPCTCFLLGGIIYASARPGMAAAAYSQGMPCHVLDVAAAGARVCLLDGYEGLLALS
jgi:hypothetical protein